MCLIRDALPFQARPAKSYLGAMDSRSQPWRHAGWAVFGGLIAAAATELIVGFDTALPGIALTTVLGGAAVGASTGGILATLIGSNDFEGEAGNRDLDIDAGCILVAVEADGSYLKARYVLRQAGADYVNAEDRAAA